MPPRLLTHPDLQGPEHDEKVHNLRSRLWFVTAISNPARFKTRYALYRKFREHVTKDLQANLLTVEVAFGQRDFQVTSSGHDITDENGVRTIDVQLTNNSYVWLKENAQNQALCRLPADYEYVVFCDADVEFCNKHIVTEIIHSLQEHRVVQPFETCCDMGPDGQVMQVHRSFGSCHVAGRAWRPQTARMVCKDGEMITVPDPYAKQHYHKGGMGEFGIPFHPGFLLAFQRKVLEKMGGLLEIGILGSGDHSMLAAIVGKAHLSYPSNVHENYKKIVLDWQARAEKVIKRDLGFTRGSIHHFFHGQKRKRFYANRWALLINNNFNPATDIRKNCYGLWEICSDKVGLRDDIRKYFLSRDEDDRSME